MGRRFESSRWRQNLSFQQMTAHYLFSLTDMQNKPALAQYAGGKARGLFDVCPLIAKLQKSGININIPQTFILSQTAYADYVKKGGIPDNILEEALNALSACNGLVAVRSSADIEDIAGHTYSGIFESVLNVQSEAQMAEALKTVYNSALDTTTNMAVVIQPMIANPEKAGVIYSEDFTGDPFISINFSVHNSRYPNESRNIIKLSKHVEIHVQNERKLVLLLPDNLQRMPEDARFYTNDGYYSLKQIKTDFGKELPQLIATINFLEQQLGHPIDMEFAIINETIYLLQQRPYVRKSGFIINSFKNGDIYGYRKENPVIQGSVITAGDPLIQHMSDKNSDVLELKDYILLLSDFEKQQDNASAIAVFQAAAYNKIKTKLIIDCKTGILYNALYSHIGNQLRENGQPFLISRSDHFLTNTESGDYLTINMQTQQYTRIAKK